MSAALVIKFPAQERLRRPRSNRHVVYHRVAKSFQRLLFSSAHFCRARNVSIKLLGRVAPVEPGEKLLAFDCVYNLAAPTWQRHGRISIWKSATSPAISYRNIDKY
jgi:hypothetical protein